MKIRQVPSVYSRAQLDEYLARIHWSKVSSDPPVPTLECLRELMRAHLCSIPFTNTFLTYEAEIPSVDPQELFQRIVRDGGGFFCFGQNQLFREILRAIGFRCYAGVGRVNGNMQSDDPIQLGTLSHMTVFVTFNEDEQASDEDHLYLVDVGFGALVINEPLPLHLNSESNGALDEVHRISALQHPKTSFAPLSKTQLASATSPPLPLGMEYCLQWQARTPDGAAKHDWRTCYVFSTAESYTEDFETAHFAICRRGGLFVQNVILCLHQRPLSQARADSTTNGEHEGPLGRLTIFNDSMKLRHSGQRDEQVTKFKSEEERMAAFRKQGGIANLPDNALEIIKKKGLAL